jgi:hypothetical protein
MPGFIDQSTVAGRERQAEFFFSFWLGKYKDKRNKCCVQIYLVENWIFSLEASASKLDNLLISARLLPTELVAWESKDFKT